MLENKNRTPVSQLLFPLSRMSKPFGSRLANLREKRTSQAPQQSSSSPLQLPEDDTIDYQPSQSNQNRTGTRFFKGRIEKSANTLNSADHQNLSTTAPNKENLSQPREQQSKPSLTPAPKQESNSGLRLVLNDEPQFERKKSDSFKTTATQPQQKRLLIQKKQSIEEPKVQVAKKVEPISRPSVEEQVVPTKKESAVVNTNAPIHEQDVEESKDFDENQLVECPEGCGRKFNRKALEKHAKACKLVFMSKRKEFNSEAKRFGSEEQAKIVKQTKIEEKRGFNKAKTKDMRQTNDNWKAASEDFRTALKAVKEKEAAREGEELKTISCEYCQKPFAEALLAAHVQNCLKRKEKEQRDKKKTTKKK